MVAPVTTGPRRLALTRDQLAAFLPNHEAVKAFEQLFSQVQDVIPANNSELEAVVGQGRTPNNDQLRLAVQAIVEQQPSRTVNLDPILKRLDMLEMQISQKTNLTPVLTSINDIKTFLGI